MSEPLIRLAAFAAVFGLMALVELLSPRLERPELVGALKTKRWRTNVSLLVISSVMLRIVFPAGAVGAALFAETRDWGLMRAIGVPGVFAGIFAFVILDFSTWFAHLASHKLPVLWRIHRMHHADPGFDVTTGLRFHPLEILLSMGWKTIVVIALGAPVLSVLIFEIVLNATSMFSHANIRLPLAVDALLRRLIVTPDMHRVHHSVLRAETDSNYGFNLALWDRLFGTYVAQPGAGHDAMQIGLGAMSASIAPQLGASLAMPIRGERQ